MQRVIILSDKMKYYEIGLDDSGIAFARINAYGISYNLGVF